MLRELNEEEMMMVSGGDAPEMPDPTAPMSTMDSILSDIGIYRYGSGNDPANAPGGANYEVVATGTRHTSPRGHDNRTGSYYDAGGHPHADLQECMNHTQITHLERGVSVGAVIGSLLSFGTGTVVGAIAGGIIGLVGGTPATVSNC